jgi:hypothetical protein
MAAAVATQPQTQPKALPAPVPVRELLPWLAFGALVLLLALYFVTAEQGATSIIGGSMVHELVHDARHLVGVPCH